MSTAMSEGTNSGEGQNSTEINAKLAELSAALEAERKSKERILEESKKYKEGYQTFKQKQDELEKQKATQEEERLKKEGQYNVLLEQRESKIKDLEEALNGVKKEVESRDTAITNFRKAAAFERALGGKLRKDSYWNHVDFDKIAINPDNGEIDAHTLQKVAGHFIENYKELVDFGPAGNLPNGSASGSGKLTYEQWKALPVADRKKRMKDVTR